MSKDASVVVVVVVVVVPKEDDLVRAVCDSDILGVWLSIVGAGLAVKSVDAPPGAPPLRHAAAALRAPATFQFTPQFDDRHSTLTERWRELARQKDSVWKEAPAPAATLGGETPLPPRGARRVDDLSQFRSWLIGVRRMVAAAGVPQAVGPRRTRYGTAR